MTYLTVSIMVDTAESALARAALAAERGADMVEYRIDHFAQKADAAAITDLLKRSPLPCILTNRPVWEGGHYEGDETSRQNLLDAIDFAACPAAYLDMELVAYQKGLRPPKGARVILSSHDFQTRPADLLQRVHAMADAARCSVVKVAWRARSLRDNLEAFELLSSRVKPMIALCMDEAGLPSRVLARKFGAFLTFAGLDDGATTAPGQVGVETLKRLYRWDKLTESTRTYGVIGCPVGHSLSPHIMNAGFDAADHDGVYLPLLIPDDYVHFKATVGAWLDFAPLHFRGASVTIPHKQNLLRFVAESGGTIEPLAASIGAANTLTVGDDGALYASNTDYAAALDAVCDAMHIGRDDLADQRVGVIGAGGAARAIVAGFAHYGATIVVYNRTLDKATELAEQFNGQTGQVVAAPMANLSKSCCRILINCTPLGMHPNVDASPITDWPDKASADEGTVVFDTIYNPRQTKLLREASARGCVTISGIEMFIRQAAAQFEQWTKRAAPTEVFRRVIEERLTK
ncbi:MAG: type I 3-dehydroquinate dehydratase [Planctomycetes bacterium]|nr:type I 3-dehydroquinate dehydratase [Planctomycetota bacterium]